MDKEEGMVIVSGNADPKIVIDKFEKWGRKAQLLSFQKDSLLLISRLPTKIAPMMILILILLAAPDLKLPTKIAPMMILILILTAVIVRRQTGSKMVQPVGDILVSKYHLLRAAERIPTSSLPIQEKAGFAWFWNLFRRKEKEKKKKKSLFSSEISRVRSPTTTKRSNADTGRNPKPRWPNNNRSSERTCYYGITQGVIIGHIRIKG